MSDIVTFKVSPKTLETLGKLDQNVKALRNQIQLIVDAVLDNSEYANQDVTLIGIDITGFKLQLPKKE